MVLNFAEFLRERRLARGITTVLLAEQLEVSPQYISHLERGRRRPSKAFMARCAALLGENVEYIRFLAQPIPESEKRAIAESPSAPAYLPEDVRSAPIIGDDPAALVRAMLRHSTLPLPAEDTPFHFAEDVDMAAVDISFQTEFVDRVNQHPDDFPIGVRLWSEFYRAYYGRLRAGRTATLTDLSQLASRIAGATGDAAPALGYLVAIHHGLALLETGDLLAAADRFASAHARAAEADDPRAAVCARWHQAVVFRAQGDLPAAIEALEDALQTDRIDAFGLARVRTDLIEAYLDAWQNQQAADLVEAARVTWRSSAIGAETESRSLALLRVEISALEAAIRLEQYSDAEIWLTRARSLHSRLPAATVEDARMLICTAQLVHHRESNRASIPRARLVEASRLDLPADHRGRRVRDRARELLAEIAIEEGQHYEARGIIAELEGESPVDGMLPELERQARTRLVKCRLEVALGDAAAANQSIQEVEDALTGAPDALRGALTEHLLERVGVLREAAAAPA
ncbi:helix-turn-helix domain-containing protein [Candidatus Poribacteria bacterium]|jgi:transcriptional regulator with XRE-family HTH domain|nr:helix-turn-helix domain-containing protein [Candidatus Poribacteria bacterium]MBT5536274.1 helix-turn-helix domain-containing protein [Candidatus Poribacteria bacterium]MBT7100713.1 helix-turn-helix domain-containing protein [Candidatus Poribacteria bacterium]MBT7806604.1 helix-turn-helix domain-containing protein [Candidatus Poribacteria bacterium]